MTRQEAFQRIERANAEFEAARFAVAEVWRKSRVDPTLLRSAASNVRPSHLRDCAGHLELTYLLRLFTEFERILRSYWSAARPSPRVRRTRMEILMQRVAGMNSIPGPVLASANEVRENRNDFVHGSGVAHKLTFGESKSRLARFTSFLPRRW